MKKNELITDEFNILDQKQCLLVSGGNIKIVLDAAKYAAFAYEALKSFMEGVVEGWTDCSEK